MKMNKYCITWGEIGIQTFVVAGSVEEAIQKLQNDINNEFGSKCEIDIKSVDIIR